MKESLSDTHALRWHWSTWRMLEMTVAVTAIAQREGDETTVNVAEKAARVAAKQLGVPPTLLAKMQRDAARVLGEVSERPAGPVRDSENRPPSLAARRMVSRLS